MKRVFGLVEIVFDIFYFISATIIGLILIFVSEEYSFKFLSGIMALILVFGDFFHLIPRIKVIIKGNEERYRKSLGRGKQITSITMTLFYLILWHIGIIVFQPTKVIFFTSVLYILAFVRIYLCFLKRNKWEERRPPVRPAILRNIPFLLQGLMVSALFFSFRNNTQELKYIWLAVLLSFAFYIPVVLFVNKNPKIGMLMIPKTLTYLWLMIMFM